MRRVGRGGRAALTGAHQLGINKSESQRSCAGVEWGWVGVVVVKAAASLRRCLPSVTSEAAAVALVTSPDPVPWVYVLISRLSPLMRKS